jgi:stage V sporulation protein R
VIARFRNAAKRIKKYSDNPHIGVDAVEKAIDACHALKYHNYREFGINRKSHEEIRQGYVDIANFKPEELPEDFNINKIPLEPDYDILGFIAKYSRNLEPWQRDIINIVREESMYFMPQAMTKIMNEGWASFWHYKIMSEMDLPQEFHLSFLKFHNQVLRPMVGKINPYHLGFTIFKWIEKNKGLEECFIARSSHNDESFIRSYLNKEICEDLNLFSYSKKKKEWTIDDISDEEGWKQIRADLIKNVGLNSLPNIYIRELQKDQTLVLEHEHDGRDLDLDYAHNVCDHLLDLWGDDFKFYTIIEEEPFEI